MQIQPAGAQNYLHQSFDSTGFPPGGWSNVYVKGAAYGGSVTDTIWNRESSYSFIEPSAATHTGTGMAAYNSWGLYPGSEALLVTPAMDFTSYISGLNKLTFWFYKSNVTDIGWDGYEADTLNVWVNKNATLSGAVKLKTLIDGIRNVPVVSTAGWYQYIVDLPDSFSSSSHVYIIFDAVSAYNVDLFLDDVSIDHIPECSGIPNVTLKPGPAYMPICIGGTFTLSGIGDGNVVGQKYQWQMASSSTGPWTNITGATDTIYTTNATFSGTAYFRLKDSCAGSGSVAYSLPDTIVQVAPAYATIPYVQDFEHWQNYCNVLDVPGSSWYNIPAFGLGSWRRDDQGCAYGGWSDTGCSMYAVNSLGGNTYISGAHCARFHSLGELSAAATPWEAALDLYIDCSGAGNKLLQFYFKNQASLNTPYAGYNNDSLCVFISTDGGVTFNKLWGADTAQEWKKIRVQLTSSSATTVVRFLGKRNGGDPIGVGETGDLSDIGLDSVYVGPACAGLASGGAIIPSGTVTECPAGSYSLSVAGIPPAGGITCQWQKATAPFSSFTDIAGATDIRYTTPVLFDTVQYRLKVTCPYTAPATVLNSAVTTLKITPIPYASINTSSVGSGYHYSFENWGNRCATYDAPVIGAGTTISNWANYPATGENSWRREDEGTSAGWSYPWAMSPYGYSPVAYDSSHSARFYTYDHYGSRAPGNLYLFVDCSADTNTKELQYNANIDSVSRGFFPDTLASWLSTDGGNTYSLLRKDYNGKGTWQQVKISLPGNTAKTVIRFQGIYGSPNASTGTGLGLDDVKILLKCNGKPTAGILTGDSVCINDTAVIKLKGNTEATGIYYVWQQSTDSIAWTNISGYNTGSIAYQFTTNTYLRAIAVCSNTGQTDTGSAALFVVRPFYKCYCNPVSNVASYYGQGAVGNVTIVRQTGDTVMNHTTTNNYVLFNDWAIRVCTGDLSGLKGYIDCRDTIKPASLYLDSTYKMLIEEVSPTFAFYGGYPVNVYIDYNHNANFDSSAELVFNKSTTSVSSPVATDTFTIPYSADTGVTGMRILLGIYFTSPLNPCGGNYNYGEIRDYLVNITYGPCSGPTNAGRSISSTTSRCFGESFVIIDNSHNYKSTGIAWSWLKSSDRINWRDIPLTAGMDTLTQIFDTAAWYRLQLVCSTTHDTTYSNNIRVVPDSPYRCYCYSAATGGNAADTSDIDSFSFGPYTVNMKGARLLNAAATNGHARYDDSVLDLFADTTYHVTVSPTFRTAVGGNAKVTLFIDYNNNLKYDIPQERLWTGYTSSALWDIATNIKIPDTVTSDVPTGMRLILNNNVGANAASDEGCGTYTSGETMDFVVRFNHAWATGVGSINNLQNLVMYPNPSDGKFKVSFSSQGVIKDLKISISNMTGQQVFAKSYMNTQGQFNTEIDLSGTARGVYFVEFMADGERMIRKLVLK